MLIAIEVENAYSANVGCYPQFVVGHLHYLVDIVASRRMVVAYLWFENAKLASAFIQ